MTTSTSTADALAVGARQAARRVAVPLVVLYLAALLTPLMMALALGKRGKDSLTYQAGLNMALVGLAILCLQFVLITRFRWMERPFGQDVIISFHRAMGMFASGLILVHPLLLAAGHRGWPLLLGLSQAWYIWVGRVALLLLVVVAAQAIFRSRLRLSYQKWKSWHNTLSIVMLLVALLHVWLAGGDSKLAAMKAVWLLLGALALAAFLWQRFGRAARLRRHPFVVTGVREEAKDVWTLELSPQKGDSMPLYLPGQYQYLTLLRKDFPVEEHPFTFSSSPTQEKSLSSTIKASGDLTRRIGKVRVGDLALVDAPYGRFSPLLFPEEKQLVFLAGGIGITPMMSVLRFLRDTRSDKEVVLLYSNSTPEDIAFRDELCALEDESALQVKTHFFLSKPCDGWKGETGHIDEAALRRLLGEVAGRGFYICGPLGFLLSITSYLLQMNVPKERIHFESFSS